MEKNNLLIDVDKEQEFCATEHRRRGEIFTFSERILKLFFVKDFFSATFRSLSNYFLYAYTYIDSTHANTGKKFSKKVSEITLLRFSIKGAPSTCQQIKKYIKIEKVV